MLLKALEAIAYSSEQRALLESDINAFLKQYPELTSKEKDLIKRRDSMAIESYLMFGPNHPNVSCSTPIIVAVVVAAVIVIMVDDPKNPDKKGRFKKYWERVISHSEDLAGLPAHC
jgi:hypothetical protein